MNQVPMYRGSDVTPLGGFLVFFLFSYVNKELIMLNSGDVSGGRPPPEPCVFSAAPVGR